MEAAGLWGAIGALVLGALLGLLTPLKDDQPVPVPVPVRDDD